MISLTSLYMCVLFINLWITWLSCPILVGLCSCICRVLYHLGVFEKKKIYKIMIWKQKNPPSSSSSSEVSSLSELLSLISDATLSCIGFMVMVKAESSQSNVSAVTLNVSCSSLPLFKRTIEIPTRSITKKTQMAIIKIVEWELWAEEERFSLLVFV